MESLHGVLCVLMAFMLSGFVMVSANRTALLVFGDSLVDSGNNNFIPSLARADSKPYGIDFSTHQPTGRFSNGKNMPDILCDRLGIPLLLPYLDPKNRGENLLHGANFASAGVGILNDTGLIFLSVIRFPQQLDLFKRYKRRVAALIGEKATEKMISEALVSVTLGGNDFVNNYYLPMSPRARQYNLSDYTALLVTEFRKQLIALSSLGARQIMVSSIGPLGCVPSVLSKSKDGDCDKKMMEAAQGFDKGVEEMLDGLRLKLPYVKFLFTSAFGGKQSFLLKPKSFGFETSKTACCGQGAFNGQGLCMPVSDLCGDRAKFVFWDAFHPTERACEFLVDGMIHGSHTHIRPFNLSTLLAREIPCYGCNSFPLRE